MTIFLFTTKITHQLNSTHPSLDLIFQSSNILPCVVLSTIFCFYHCLDLFLMRVCKSKTTDFLSLSHTTLRPYSMCNFIPIYLSHFYLEFSLLVALILPKQLLLVHQLWYVIHSDVSFGIMSCCS